jgi:hypothetical protein
MRLEKVNEMAKIITESTSKGCNTEVILTMGNDEHESLQQEVFKLINKTIVGYSSKKNFEIIISDVRFIIKQK